MKFKPGDRVRVRQWDDMAAEYELDRNGDIEIPLLFIRPMKSFCGLEATYTGKNGETVFLVDRDREWQDLNWDDYRFSEEMLELVPIEISEGDLIDVLFG